MDRGVVNINLWWHNFIEGLECQILNVSFSACFVKQRWPIEGKMQEGIKIKEDFPNRGVGGMIENREIVAFL